MNEKRSIMGSVFEYIKRAATPFLLNLMFGLTMFAVALIDITALKIALMAVLLACTLLSNFIFSRSAGELAYKAKVAGELKRQGLPAGMTFGGKKAYSPYKEYAPYKGFVIALVSELPAIVLLVIIGITNSGTVKLALWIAAGWSIIPVMAISMNASYYFGFLLCAVFAAVGGVAYIIGGGREKLRQFALARRTQQIDAAKSKGEDL